MKLEKLNYRQRCNVEQLIRELINKARKTVKPSNGQIDLWVWDTVDTIEKELRYGS